MLPLVPARIYYLHMTERGATYVNCPNSSQAASLKNSRRSWRDRHITAIGRAPAAGTVADGDGVPVRRPWFGSAQSSGPIGRRWRFPHGVHVIRSHSSSLWLSYVSPAVMA